VKKMEDSKSKINPKLTELLLQEIGLFDELFYGFPWPGSYSFYWSRKTEIEKIRNISKELSKYPKTEIEEAIRDLENKEYVEHLNLEVLLPKKIDAIGVREDKDNNFSIITGNFIGTAPVQRYISSSELQDIYYKIIDGLFPEICFVKVGCPKGPPDDARRWSDDVLNIMKFVKVEEIVNKTEERDCNSNLCITYLFKLSRKKVIDLFGCFIFGSTLLDGWSFLTDSRTVSGELSPTDLFRVVEVYDQKDNPNVIFQLIDLGISWHELKIKNPVYKEKFIKIIKKYAEENSLIFKVYQETQTEKTRKNNLFFCRCEINPKLTELLLQAIELFDELFYWSPGPYSFYLSRKKERLKKIRNISKELSKYPKTEIEEAIRDLENKEYVEHLNLEVLLPKKIDAIGVREDKDNNFSIITGNFIGTAPVQRYISSSELQDIYYKIIDGLFPEICFVKVGCPKGCEDPQLWPNDVLSIMKLVKVEEEVNKTDEGNYYDITYLFKLSREKVKHLFGSFILGSPLLDGANLLIDSETISGDLYPVSLFIDVEVYDQKDNPNVIFQLIDLGISWHELKIKNPVYKEKFIKIIKKYAEENNLIFKVK